MALFRAREIREGASPDELRRQMNEAFRAIERDLSAALSSSKVSEVITASTYAPGFGEVARVAPPSGGLRLILPEPNLARLGSRITVVQEAASGALSVEVVNGTINGAATLAYLAGIGTVEFILTPSGWFGWSVSLVASLPLTALASQADDTFVGNISGASAIPVAVGLASIDSASIIWDAASHTFQRAALTGDVTASQNANALTIANGAVTNAKRADMAAATLSGRALGAGTGVPTDLTAGQVVDIIETEAVTWTATQNFEGQLRLGTEQTDANTGAINVTLGDVCRLRFTDASGNHTLGTISGGAEGRLLLLEFNGTGTHTLTHATTANGTSCPGSVDLVMVGRSGCVMVARDAGGGDFNWRVLATTN